MVNSNGQSIYDIGLGSVWSSVMPASINRVNGAKTSSVRKVNNEDISSGPPKQTGMNPTRSPPVQTGRPSSGSNRGREGGSQPISTPVRAPATSERRQEGMGNSNNQSASKTSFTNNLNRGSEAGPPPNNGIPEYKWGGSLPPSSLYTTPGRLNSRHPCRNVIGKSNPFAHECWKEHITGIIRPLMSKSESGKWACGDTQALGAHQHVVIEQAKIIAAGGPPETNTHRGLMVYQNTGSGKTVVAMGIAASFWKTADRIYFVTTRDNIRGNPPSEYAQNMLLFFPEMVPVVFAGAPLPPRELWTRSKLRTPYGDGMTVLKWCNTVGQSLLQRKMGFQTFINFSQDKAVVPLKEIRKPGKWVVIVDEAQNLFKFPNNNRKQLEGLKAMQNALTQPEYMKHTFVFPLTATPGDNPRDVLNLVNIVRPYNTPPITVQEFANNPSIIKGLVSYADIRGDKSKFGTITTTKRGIGMAENVKVPYDPAYFAAYVKAIKAYGSDLSTFEEGKGKLFFGKSREGSIMLPRKIVERYHNNLNTKGPHHTYTPGGWNTQYVLSTKTIRMMENIKTMQGCQYAYVHSQKVLKALGPAFISAGFEIVNLSRIQGESFESVRAIYGKPRPRVVLYHPGNMVYPDNSKIEGASAAVPRLKAVLQLFKSPENSQGQLIKAVVGTPFEGLDMSYLRGVHILAPLPTLEDDEQAVGRALRFCGHKENAKTVAIYRYFGVPPKQPIQLSHLSDREQAQIERDVKDFLKMHPDGINARVFEDARRRGLPMKKFMDCVKAHSTECGIDPEKGGLLGPIQFGDKVRCGIERCEVELTKEGKLVIPKERQRIEERIVELKKNAQINRVQSKSKRERVMEELKERRLDNEIRRDVTGTTTPNRRDVTIPKRLYNGPYKLSPVFISKFDRRRYG